MKKKNINLIKIYWNKKIAISIAKNFSIKLKKNHWKIIFFMRKFYKKYNITPTTRMLILTLKKEKKIFITSQDLFILFKETPMKNISKIAGLPKPQQCL